MKLSYFVVQCLSDGEWINYSCRYFIHGLSGALKEYKTFKREKPNIQLRIAKGKDEIRNIRRDRDEVVI